MARIGSALNGMERVLLDRMAEANAAATVSLMRLATLKKINAPSDDPAGFVALSGLQAQLGRTSAAATNATAAGSLLTQVQTTVSGIDTQLDAIRAQLLLDEGGTLTPDERAAAQAAIDSAISQINALASGAIGGRRPLDGSADFAVSGRNAAQVARVAVQQTGGATRTISGTVTAAAAHATLTYQGNASDQVTDTAAFTLSGATGNADVEVTAGTALADLAAAVNRQSHNTGVTAAVDLVNHRLTFTSVAYGSDALSKIVVSSGTFVVTGGDGAGTAHGTDAAAEINGVAYTGDGNAFTVNQNGFQFTLEIAGGFSGAFDELTVSGDALSFALTPEAGRTSTLAISSLSPAHLGGLSGSLAQLVSGQSLSGLGNNTSQAIRVVDEALAQLGLTQAKVGGFQSASVESASTLLAELQSDLEDAIDAVDLVDIEEEEQRLSYYQSLASNAVAGLSVLNQQRAQIVRLIQVTAGLY